MIIYSPYDCLIKYKNEQIILDQNEHAILENVDGNIAIFPLNKNSQYSFFIDLKEFNSSFYRTIKNNNEILVFLLDGIIAENVDVFSFSYKEDKSSIEIGKNQIIFKTEKYNKIIPLPFSPQNVKCGNFGKINYACFDDKNRTYFIAYNTQTNKSKLFQGDEIEIKENGIVVINKKNNFYKEIVEEYFVDNDGLKVKSKVFSKKDNINSRFVCFEFVNSIKLKDFDGAFDMLSPDLQKKLTPNNLKEFLGDISYFYMIDSSTCFAISNNENTIFNFVVKDEKIMDISDNR